MVFLCVLGVLFKLGFCCALYLYVFVFACFFVCSGCLVFIGELVFGLSSVNQEACVSIVLCLLGSLCLSCLCVTLPSLCWGLGV